MSYELAKHLIQAGKAPANIRDILGVLLIGGAVTDEQYQELIGMLEV